MSSPIVSRLYPSGAWEVSDIVGGYRYARTYYGYTRAQALRQFKEELKICLR